MVLSVISVEHQYRIGDHFRSFRIQFADYQNAVHSAATAGISMYQIYFSVLVPKWCRIDHSFSGFHQYGFAPCSFRISSLYHVNSIIRIAPINIKFSLMKADSRSPYTFPMLRFIEKLFGFLYRQRIIHQRPVYQITGMKYRKSRYAIKTGSRHIEIISCRTYVRIGIVGIKHRVLISTIAFISHPCPGYFLCTRPSTASHHSCYKQNLFTHITLLIILF